MGVVGSGGVEGRVQIDEVHRLVLEVAAEDVEVVAAIKRAHVAKLSKGPVPGNGQLGVLARTAGGG